MRLTRDKTSIDRIASGVGFRSADVFRRAFRTRYGTPRRVPGALRPLSAWPESSGFCPSRRLGQCEDALPRLSKPRHEARLARHRTGDAAHARPCRTQAHEPGADQGRVCHHPTCQRDGLCYVQADPVTFTAGGLTSGIDLALHMVADRFGPDVAQQTADFMEHLGTGWKTDLGISPLAMPITRQNWTGRIGGKDKIVLLPLKRSSAFLHPMDSCRRVTDYPR